LFFNPDFVDLIDDYGPEFAEAEGINVRQSLLALGHLVRTFTATDAAGVANALSGMDMVVFPYLEMSAYTPSQDVEDVYSNFVASGGTMLVHGNYRSIDLLNSIFEFSLQRVSGSGGPSTKTEIAAADPSFDAAPSYLAQHGSLHPIIGQTLPPGSKIHYSVGGGTHAGSAATIVEIPYGAGSIVYIAWDWFNAAPEGTKDSGWLAAYDGAIDAALPASAAGSALATDNGETIVGTPGDDIIWGLGGNDVIFGREGNDTLDGNAGHDDLLGEAGDDVLRISGTDDDSADGGAGTDTLVLDFADNTTGITRYPNLGGYSALGGHEGGYEDGAGHFIAYSEIERFVITTGTGNDVIETGDGDDVVSTGDGADRVTALAGNDRLDGGGGSDRLVGGTGDDTYFVDVGGAHSGDPLADQIVEAAGEGTDMVLSSATYWLPANVENLTLTGTAPVDGTGNGLNNRITGNAASNVIRGGGGTDIFSGGGGDDVYHVEADVTVSNRGGYTFTGIDQVIESAGGGVDTIYSNASITLPAQVENVVLVGDLNLSVFGNELDNRIVGNAGRNFIQAHAGNDYVDGGAGGDHMDGGAGNDTYVVDDINDLIIESPDGGTDRVISSITYQLSFELEHLTLQGSAAIDGTANHRDNELVGNDSANSLRAGAGNDVVQGNGGNDTIVGDFGDDVIDGGAGADSMTGGPGADRFVYRSLADSTSAAPDTVGDFQSGIDKIDLTALGPVSVALADRTDSSGNRFSLVTVTRSTGTMTLHVYPGISPSDFLMEAAPPPSGPIVGTDGDDVLIGTDRSDEIDGGAGNDRLSGLGGDDRLNGGDGNDTLDGGAGTDTLRGGAGNDHYLVDTADIVIESAGGGFDRVFMRSSYTLSAGAEIEQLATADYRLTGYVLLRGNEFNNAVTGNNGDNSIDGLGGDDYLVGLEGNDRLDGGTGADFMVGGIGNDIYIVDHHFDEVRDSVGEGLDYLFTSTDYALRPGVEIELFATSNYALTTPLFLTGNELNNAITGNNGNNQMSGEGGDDHITGLDGRDIMDGGSGVDWMVGGTGNDVYYVDNAGDVAVELAGEGFDSLYTSTSYRLTPGADIDQLGTRNYLLTTPLNIAGNEFNNNIIGSNGANVLEGLGGADSLTGLDGDDILDGGAGQDFLTGGAGSDVFRFAAASGSAPGSPDRITDFVSGTDEIELSAIDADTTTAGDQAFTFVGSGAFTGTAGQLRVAAAGSGAWEVQGDVDGDGIADLLITVYSAQPLVPGDFIP
jgi:Ca2+-binding RTX toxin-like protein